MRRGGFNLSEGASLRESGALGLQIDSGVAIGGLDAGVSEPMADGDEVDAGLEKMDGGRVSERVRVDALPPEGRRRRPRA